MSQWIAAFQKFAMDKQPKRSEHQLVQEQLPQGTTQQQQKQEQRQKQQVQMVGSMLHHQLQQQQLPEVGVRIMQHSPNIQSKQPLQQQQPGQQQQQQQLPDVLVKYSPTIQLNKLLQQGLHQKLQPGQLQPQQLQQQQQLQVQKVVVLKSPTIKQLQKRPLQNQQHQQQLQQIQKVGVRSMQHSPNIQSKQPLQPQQLQQQQQQQQHQVVGNMHYSPTMQLQQQQLEQPQTVQELMKEIKDLKQQLESQKEKQQQEQQPLCHSCGFQIQQKQDEAIESKLIEMFHIFRCLWDENCLEYKNPEKKNNAKLSIMRHCDLQSIKQVDSKIRQLRNRYRKEKDQVECSTRSGCGVDDVYKPTWQGFYKLDEFLRNTFDAVGPWKYPRKTNLDPFVKMKPLKNPAEITCPTAWKTLH